MTRSFENALAEGPMVFDGAIGTRLYERGYFINRSFDEANLIQPEVVLRIHGEYVDAGAQVIETNTFSANRILLGRYGAADRLADINREGVRLAREAAGEAAFVAGAVGPTGEGLGMLTAAKMDDIVAAMKEQIACLVDAGVDLIVLETFHHLAELHIALDAARLLTKVPVVAQMAFEEDGCLRDGSTPARVARLLVDWGADVVGANCGAGPQVLFDVAKEMVEAVPGHPVSVQPNAGTPRRLDERTLYMATPEYFGVFARRFFKAGVRIVGGCCGTGPEHIRAVAAARRMIGGHSVAVALPRTPLEPEAARTLAPVPMEQKSALGAKIRRVWRECIASDGPRRPFAGPADFVVSVEVNPQPGLDVRRPIEGARMLRDAGVDVVNIADGPRASVRMSNWSLAMEIMEKTGMEVILHVCCRDRNLLALQADLLGCHIRGIRNLVIITGDPPKLGDYPKATAVFDLDSVELLKLVDCLNHGIDPAGKMINETTAFLLACGAEPGALDYDRELRRLEQKIRNGAEFIMTQPVYDRAVLRRFLDDTRSFGVPVLVGLLPLASARNADFLHNEVPGMSIPAAIRERMAAAGNGPPARNEGIRIAREMLAEVRDEVVGAYIMPPFARYRSALEILSVAGYEVPPETP